MDKKTRIILALIVCVTMLAWVWITYFIEQTTWKPDNNYMNELSEYNYEIARVNAEGLHETNIDAYRKAYYDRANFLYKNTRCKNAINDYSVALENCDWKVYEGVCSNAPGYIKRGNCYFKDFQFKLFFKDYMKFISMHIIRTIALVVTVILAFCKKFLLFVAPIFLIVLTFCYIRYKNRNNSPMNSEDDAASKNKDKKDDNGNNRDLQSLLK